MSQDAFPILVPQLNVNDEQVRFVRWLVEPGDTVAAGQVICVVETSKAATDLEAERSGVVVPTAAPDEMVGVGGRIGYIGASREAAEAALTAERSVAPAIAADDAPRATPRAQALAREQGLSLAEVAALGVPGTIKEEDVRRALAARGPSEPVRQAPVLPGDLTSRVTEGQPLGRHERAALDGLEETARSLILATVDYELDLSRVRERLRAAQRDGLMLSLMHLAIAAAGRVLPKFPRLMSVRRGTTVFTYRGVDVAFLVRTPDGRLFTPVVRAADTLDAAAVARACGAMSMRVHRGRIAPEDLDGGCFTVSSVAEPGVSRFVALPNRYQSAILAVAAEREVVRIVDGTPAGVPVVTLVLSYDHGLCDGILAAQFLRAVGEEMERL